MSQLVIDLKKDLKRFKADEHMLGFAGFSLAIAPDRSLDGVLKIASESREGGGGYLTLTIIVDTCSDAAACADVERMLGRLGRPQAPLSLGPGFDYAEPFAPILDDGGALYMGELTLFFKTLDGLEKVIVRRLVLPALEKALAIAFEPVSWWDEQG